MYVIRTKKSLNIPKNPERKDFSYSLKQVTPQGSLAIVSDEFLKTLDKDSYEIVPTKTRKRRKKKEIENVGD